MALETFQEKLAYLLGELRNEGVFKFLDASEIRTLNSIVKSLQAVIKREALKQKLKEQGEETIRDMRNASNQGNMSMKEYVEKITAARIQNMNKESAERIEEIKKKNKNS